MGTSVQKDTFNRFIQVSRETIVSLSKYEDMLIKANSTLNLVGNSTIDQIWIRHFLDSAQVIDIIDKKCNSLMDLGSGAGFPGVILAIVAKDRKIPIKIKLIEKSPKKVKFLDKIIKQLNLDVKVLNQNVLDQQNKFVSDVFIARAFKPLKVFLELMHNKAENWKKILIFLGKTGQLELLQASKSWDIKYKQRVSVTSGDSMIIEINNLKKN